MIKFSEEQTKIIESSNDHILVIAGAGTGKTTVLIAKIKSLLEKGVNANKILAITFTKKAAKEMSERIKNDDVLIYTFDAFCYNLIKEDININIIKDNIPFYQKDVLSFHLYDANLKVSKKPKNYDQYVKYKKNNALYDFNDIEYIALRKLNNISLNLEFILVDEFQDTNKLQFTILRSLITNKTRSFVVGDPDQSIYSFRGAYKDVFKQYLQIYKAVTYKLTNNYRSNKKIVNVANKLINYNNERIKKSLISFKEDKGLVECYNFESIEKEVQFVVNLYNKMNYKEQKSFAILYRNHVQAYELKKNLYRNNLNIKVLSIHEAKGLEFDTVVIIGVNKEVFPSTIINKKINLEEERRLMFVAITRSKKKLYISSIKTPSRFIYEIGLKHRP